MSSTPTERRARAGRRHASASNPGAAKETPKAIVADLVPGARLVKAANTLAADVLGADPHDAGGRRVIFLSGDDAPAKAAVAELFDAAGFFPIDLGELVTGGRTQQLGGPLPSHNLVRLPAVR
jgi:predicted dinucleotide-binding enzyme